MGTCGRSCGTRSSRTSNLLTLRRGSSPAGSRDRRGRAVGGTGTSPTELLYATAVLPPNRSGGSETVCVPGLPETVSETTAVTNRIPCRVARSTGSSHTRLPPPVKRRGVRRANALSCQPDWWIDCLLLSAQEALVGSGPAGLARCIRIPHSRHHESPRLMLTRKLQATSYKLRTRSCSSHRWSSAV